MNRLDHAQTLLGHRFARPELLAEALTHRSAAGAKGVGSNERLEFIGDRVLGLIVAEWLIERFPNEQEGKLGPRMAALVSKPSLAEIAQNNGLAPLLNVAAGESKRGVRNQATVLADALEAVIGALYLDAGLAATQAYLIPLLRAEASSAVSQRRVKDDKSLLQELAQGQLGVTPRYVVVNQEGPSHLRVFTVEAVVGEVVIGRGEGHSKREAEQAAAHAALQDPGWSVPAAEAPTEPPAEAPAETPED